MFKKTGIFFWIVIAFLMSCSGNKSVEIEARLVKAPVGTMQLGPSIFLPQSQFEALQIKEGDPLLVKSAAGELELNAYLLPHKEGVVGLHSEKREALKLNPGKVKISLQKIEYDKAKLKPNPFYLHAENYPGDKKAWPGIAYGAPHGDCDRQTGSIVKLMTKTYGIPSTAGYGARLSYRGIWYDMNRPLMKLPKEGGGVIAERQWNDKSEAVYSMYQDSVWKNNDLQYGERFDLFCSFHGHDLTVKLKDGKRIQRPVMEAMGVGFKKDELRSIKRFYERKKSAYYHDPPLLVFGNLPEDRVYYYQGIPLNFFYSGLGTRVYGSLRADLVKHALHIETPNSMRIDPKVQPKTARFLYELYAFIKDSILVGKDKAAPKYTVAKPRYYGQKRKIKGGVFDMGAPDNVGWASEHPRHKVKLSGFSMDVYEVTNKQFADFLNQALDENKISISRGTVKDRQDTTHIICRTYTASPFSQIEYGNRMFKPLEGKAYFPVIYVSYYGAQMYARSKGERLPTEAEWEMAASWDTQTGKKYLYAYGSDKIDNKKANFEDSGDPFEFGDQAQTSPVGYYRAPGPNGLYDMSGNAFEWCSDFYEYKHYDKAPGGVWDNPQEAQEKTMRTIRGGAWNLEPWIMRTTFRLGIHPNATLINVGFRCVEDGR